MLYVPSCQPTVGFRIWYPLRFNPWPTDDWIWFVSGGYIAAILSTTKDVSPPTAKIISLSCFDTQTYVVCFRLLLVSLLPNLSQEKVATWYNYKIYFWLSCLRKEGHSFECLFINCRILKDKFRPNSSFVGRRWYAIRQLVYKHHVVILHAGNIVFTQSKYQYQNVLKVSLPDPILAFSDCNFTGVYRQCPEVIGAGSFMVVANVRVQTCRSHGGQHRYLQRWRNACIFSAIIIYNNLCAVWTKCFQTWNLYK